MTLERSLTEREREVLLHLLGGDDPLSAVLRERVRDAVVLQDRVCCASIHLLDPGPDLGGTTGRVPRKVEAAWPGPPIRAVRLVVAANGQFSHLEITHEGEATGPREFPPPEELGAPRWAEI